MLVHCWYKGEDRRAATSSISNVLRRKFGEEIVEDFNVSVSSHNYSSETSRGRQQITTINCEATTLPNEKDGSARKRETPSSTSFRITAQRLTNVGPLFPSVSDCSKGVWKDQPSCYCFLLKYICLCGRVPYGKWPHKAA